MEVGSGAAQRVSWRLVWVSLGGGVQMGLLIELSLTQICQCIKRCFYTKFSTCVKSRMSDTFGEI